MENRDRDKLSKNTEPTPAGDVNRETSKDIGNKNKDEKSTEFGKNIGRTEDLNENVDKSTGRKASVRDESSGLSGSSGRSGSIGSSGMSSSSRQSSMGDESDSSNLGGRNRGGYGEMEH